MLSILIPVYNYNVSTLIEALHKQCIESKIEFEIICQDDGSTQLFIENERINNLKNCSYFKNQSNTGRTTSRNILANKAKYSWLLFLDADVIPVNQNFISLYIPFLNNIYQVILGGYKYENTKQNHTSIFRYKYGKKCEEKSAIKRNLTPYKYIFSGNILIQKKTFLVNNYNFDGSFYGMDVYFAYQLFINKIQIRHIDNPIYHLGLETNDVFFKKALMAVKSRKKFLLNSKDIEKISPLIRYYKLLKKYHLIGITIFCFKITSPFLKRLILNKNPNLFCFNLYRLGYICYTK